MEYKKGPTGIQYTGLDTNELLTPFCKEDDTLHKAHFLLAALMAKTDP
jgi:hypothetical protein